MELAFLAAIQHLPPRQRAAVLLHDVLGWPAKQTGAILDASVASINSALQRARATLRKHLPRHRADWAPSTPPTDEQRALLRRYMSAVQQGDLALFPAFALPAYLTDEFPGTDEFSRPAPSQHP